jgi:hypothetical protein
MTSACSPMAIRGGWLQLLQTGSVMPVLKELCLRAVPSLLSSASAASRAGGMQRAAAATARGAIEVTDDARRHALNVGELSLDLCACDGSGNQPKHCQSFTCNLSLDIACTLLTAPRRCRRCSRVAQRTSRINHSNSCRSTLHFSQPQPR